MAIREREMTFMYCHF